MLSAFKSILLRSSAHSALSGLPGLTISVLTFVRILTSALSSVQCVVKHLLDNMIENATKDYTPEKRSLYVRET